LGSASQALKAPSILLNRATHLIPTTFRYQTPPQLSPGLIPTRQRLNMYPV
jgi:hypothetical protein